MSKKGVWDRILFLLLLLFFLAQAGYAIMPPDTYRAAIRASEIKVVARVKAVTVVEETDIYIEKKVEFELLKSYGTVTPAATFWGYCRGDTAKSFVGGTIYYYPEAGEVAFVTLSGDAKSGNFTSYTLLSPELSDTLDKEGLDGLEYGIGEVFVKNNKK